jgi:hypothetical protein
MGSSHVRVALWALRATLDTSKLSAGHYIAVRNKD